MSSDEGIFSKSRFFSSPFDWQRSMQLIEVLKGAEGPLE
jgi:hypothetical protein